MWTKPIGIHAFMILWCWMLVNDKSRGWRSHADFRATFVSSKYNAVEPPLTLNYLSSTETFPCLNMTVVEMFECNSFLCVPFPLKSIAPCYKSRSPSRLGNSGSFHSFSCHAYTLPYSWIHHESGILIKGYESKQSHQELSSCSFSYARFSLVMFADPNL